MAKSKKNKATLRRRHHVRKKSFGTPERPRLSVFRSNRHIYAQIIDDTVGATLAAANTASKEIAGELETTGDVKAAQAVGEAIAKEAVGVGINCVCFDRNRYRYHGKIKALAEAARKGGLSF